MLAAVYAPTARAQDGTHSWERLLAEVMSIEDSESASWQETYDMLCELEQHPIDLNSATRGDIESIPFLNERQVMDICEYLYKYAPVKSLGELAMIESLGYYQRELLSHFVVLGEMPGRHFPSLGNILRHGRHEALATAKIPCYRRKGDDNGYLGYQYKHSVKYTFSYGQWVKAGFLGSQDAGEPFFAAGNGAGYDFYSFYAQVRDMGRLKNVVVGRYKAKFGMGLVMNSDFLMGKAAASQQFGGRAYSIRVHSSRMEANYMQGAAATVAVTRWLDATAFASLRHIDATLNKDSTIATILTSGYHRTPAEMARKGNSSVAAGGLNVCFRRGGLRVGATAVFSRLSRELRPDTSAPFRRFYPAGRNFWNASVDYGYTAPRWQLTGETATGNCGAVATINAFSCRISDGLDVMALQRFYSKEYYSLYSEAFSEGGRVQDESGLYLGLNWHPSASFRVNGYFDMAYFPWPKYQAAFASHAYDCFVQASGAFGRWDFTARYRFKARGKDNQKKTALTNRVEQRGRVAVGYDGGVWSARTQADVAHVSYKRDDFGWMVSGMFSCRPVSLLSVTSSVAYFNTDSFDARIYTYERGPLYTFNFPSFYGEGIRYSLFARADLSRKVMVIAKTAVTDYFDRASIGTGLRQIAHSSMADIELQLRLKF